jgi:hypothetical protein
MSKSSSVVGLAFCLSVVATGCMAANDGTGGNVGPQRVTGTQTDSQQVANPATAGAGTVTTNQANGTYPATVGPTGSTQPDATNSSRNQPAGGGKN